MMFLTLRFINFRYSPSAVFLPPIIFLINYLSNFINPSSSCLLIFMVSAAYVNIVLIATLYILISLFWLAVCIYNIQHILADSITDFTYSVVSVTNYCANVLEVVHHLKVMFSHSYYFAFTAVVNFVYFPIFSILLVDTQPLLSASTFFSNSSKTLLLLANVAISSAYATICVDFFITVPFMFHFFLIRSRNVLNNAADKPSLCSTAVLKSNSSVVPFVIITFRCIVSFVTAISFYVVSCYTNLWWLHLILCYKFVHHIQHQNVINSNVRIFKHF